MRAFEIMSTPVVTVTPETSLAEASRLMLDRGIRGMPVIDRSGDLVGIISETDLMRYETEAGEHERLAPPPGATGSQGTVAEAMTSEPLAIDESAMVSEVAEAMIDADVSRVPVLRWGRLEGIITRHDLLEHIQERDRRLQLEVTQLLSEEGLRLPGSAVDVRDGAVTVRGLDAAQRNLAEIVLELMPDVTAYAFVEEPAAAASSSVTSASEVGAKSS